MSAEARIHRPEAPISPQRCLLPLEEAVLFPRGVTTVEVSSPEGLAALQAEPGDAALFAVAPILRLARRGEDNALEEARLAPIATLARVLERLDLGGSRVRVVLQGLSRVRRGALERRGDLLLVRAEDIETASVAPSDDEAAAARTECEASLALLGELVRSQPEEYGTLAGLVELRGGDPGRAMDLLGGLLPLSHGDRAKLLVELDPRRRAKRLGEQLRALMARGAARERLGAKVEERIRRQYLREQLDVIRTELGVQDPLEAEFDELDRRLSRTPMSAAARAQGRRELAHLRRLPPGSPQAAQLLNYVEWLLELPFGLTQPEGRADAVELARVARVLDKSHAGLAQVKQRVVEFLAVRQLGGRARGALCFSGPPGTGKSSMARAIARSLGRPFVSIQVGAMQGERELVGTPHRQEGAFPGALLDGLRRAGRPDAVVLLDEIDKLQLGNSGEAGGPLLQVLDPEQNAEFFDRYLGVPYDLSRCLFVATANDTEEMSEALFDRLEVVEFSGFTEDEKLAIARSHLLPRARADAGVNARQFRIGPGSLLALIRNYTEEAGVRQFGRLLDALARKAALSVVREGRGMSVQRRDLFQLLGPANADEELRARRPRVGVAMGLAWTSAGGSLLPVEALAMPGSGRTTLTGQVGDVLRESFQTAVSYARTRLTSLGLDKSALDELDLHLHFPSGDVPKDGPSAGLPVAVALFSLLGKRPARHDVALTGELSLHGAVLPVGGLREKLLAAIRAGIRAAIVPGRNAEEVLRLSPEIRSKIQIHLVDRVDEALELALVNRDAADGKSTRRPALARRKAGAPRAKKRAAPPPRRARDADDE